MEFGLLCKVLAFCGTVPDVWLKEGQRGKMNMWTVSPALRPGQLSYAISLRGSNLNNLPSSVLVYRAVDSLLQEQMQHRGLCPAHYIHIIKSISVVILWFYFDSVHSLFDSTIV